MHIPRLAVIGYGFAGRSFHSYLISLTPTLRLHSITVRDPEKRAKATAEHPTARLYSTFEETLADPDVDVIVLGTPHATHHPLTLQALAAGKHVITDKPIALTAAQTREMYTAARAANRHLLVFHNRRWDSDFLTLQHAIRTGQLGPSDTIRWIEMAWNRHGTWKSWRASAAMGGGRLYDLGSHMLDQLLLLQPSPVKTVYARAHFDFPDTDTPSHCQVTLTHDNGATSIIDVTSYTRHEKPRVLAIGQDATFLKFGTDPQEPFMIRGEIDNATTPPHEWPKLLTKDGLRMLPPIPGRWRSFYEHTAEVLTGQAQPQITEPQMIRLTTTLDAAHRSIREGKSIELLT
jgi:predicted dehydrogenase